MTNNQAGESPAKKGEKMATRNKFVYTMMIEEGDKVTEKQAILYADLKNWNMLLVQIPASRTEMVDGVQKKVPIDYGDEQSGWANAFRTPFEKFLEGVLTPTPGNATPEELAEFICISNDVLQQFMYGDFDLVNQKLTRTGYDHFCNKSRCRLPVT